MPSKLAPSMWKLYFTFIIGLKEDEEMWFAVQSRCPNNILGWRASDYVMGNGSCPTGSGNIGML